ncbi:hypothetical protein [Hymenobacter fodinae]|uniref:hypothetical protein n=1 Tax=Hymenobacter fodinae TaxID=2510796 RepID=UPI001AEC01D7|nr:hypothetical protein [Hymenobacter fodinae]
MTQLRAEWEVAVLTGSEPSDGFFLFAEMRTPRRRATYSNTLRQTYDRTIAAIAAAVNKPIQYAGEQQWSVFPKPDRLDRLPASVLPLLGTRFEDVCVVVAATLWHTFHRLSLYIEALCLHEWSLFTKGVVQEPTRPVTRGAVYFLPTARPDNRRPLS